MQLYCRSCRIILKKRCETTVNRKLILPFVCVSEDDFEENNVPEQEDEDQRLIIAEPEQDHSKKNHIKENNVSPGDLENQMLYNSLNSRQRSINNSKKDSIIWTHNTRLKHSVFKELKKPGRSKWNGTRLL